MNDQPQTPFEQRAQDTLRDSAEQLDAATRSRLTLARHAALDALKERQAKPWLRLVPLTAAAATAALIIVLLTNSGQRETDELAALEPVDELEILTAEDSLEFYRDVEFYAWLDTVLEEEPVVESGV